MPVAGVVLLGKGEKAYPMSLFPPGRVTVLADRIGGTDVTVISDGILVYAYYRIGLSYEDGLIRSDEGSWGFDGRAVDAETDLPHVPVTSGAYWYMWSKFHPETEVFTS